MVHAEYVAFIITFILWLIFFIMKRRCDKKGDIVSSGVFLTLEWSAVGYLWLFLGFAHHWW